VEEKCRIAAIFCLWSFLRVFTLAAQTEAGIVRGTLSNTITGQPISGAQISLIPTPAGGPAPSAGMIGRYVAVSDNAGHFTIDGVQAGRYIIQAQFEGYLIPPPPNTHAVSVVGGKTEDVALAMVQGSVISGRVRDAYGQPLSDATVNAYVLVYHNGFPALQSVAEKMTDDRGEYRLFWLPPGEYYLAVAPRAPTRGARGPQAVKTFYPGAANASDANRSR
jgi:Carboxypeptidase regulatory-like domain